MKMMTSAWLLLCAASVCAISSKADIPRPEYPRPQFVRSAWRNLNGTDWTFCFDQKRIKVIFTGNGR